MAIDSHIGEPMSTYSLAQAKDHLSRLVDEALSGEPVVITRHGKPVVSLTPSQPAVRPFTAEDLERLRRLRESRPSLGVDSVTLVREMRDEYP